MEGVGMAATEESVGWARGLDALMERIAPRFRRVAARRRARACLQGLLAPVERKNGWQLAENAGHRTLDGVQDFLARMRPYQLRLKSDPSASLSLGRCRHGLQRWGRFRQSGATLVLEPVALALDGDHRRMVQQPIEHRGGEYRVAGEGLIP